MSVQINVAANQAALTASIQAGVQAYNQRFAQNNQLNLTINPRAFSQPLGRITGDVKDFEAALAASNARVIAFGASTAVLGGVIRSFKELANVTIEVEKNLADINRVFGLTTSQLQKFSTDLFNVTKQTASSFNDASQAALEFSRQGLKAEETLQRTKDALTLTRLAGVSTANAVDALTSTVNGFAATGVTTTQILNKLVAVEQDFAVGAGDLAEALSRTGQAAQEAGVSLDQLNALVTSAQQSTARGGAVIGNALKTIFTRLQRTDTLDQLEAFNISVRDVQGNILPAVTILQNFAGAYQNLADAQRAQLSEQVAGVYQVNILKAIVNDLNKSQGVYAGALQRGAMATNEAEVATAKLNQTLDALLKQTATSTQQLANNIGKVTFEPLARYGTEQLKSLVESMNEILEGEGIGSTFANGLLKGIRNILAGPGAIAAFFTLFKLIQNSFTYLTQALPQIAGITTETQNRKNIEQSILQIMAQQGPVAQALAGTMGNQAAQAQLLLQVARQQTAEYQTQTALARQLAAQLAGQGVRVRGSGGLQVTRAGGYIPASTKMAEVVGAKAGGYSPGRVVSSPVGGVMNTAEDVKYVPGFAQPFINPPAGSKAGRAHRQNAINRTGVDPYMNDGFIPNFAVKQFINDKGEVITGKKPNKTRDSYTLRLANYNPKNLKADEDLDLKRNLVDSGYWNDSVRDPKTGKIIHYHGERNDIYDTLSGNLKVVKYLNKDEVDKATKIAWDGLISGNKAWISDPDITKLGMDQSSVEAAFDRTKAKLGLTLEDFQFKKQASEDSSKAAGNEKYRSVKNKTVYKTSEEFEKSLKGDFSNFIGDFYEQLVLKNKNVSDDYQISAGNTDPADLVPKILGSTMYKGIEAKNTAARINDLIAKAIRINVPKMNQETWDKSNDVDFGTLPIYQTMGARATVSHNGFIPNFSPLIDDNARNKHDFPGGIPILPIPDKALQNIVDRQKKRQMTYLDFDRTLVRTMGDIAYSRVSPDQKKGVLQKMFLNKEARLNDIKNSKLTQFGELLRKKIQEGVINPSLLGLLTASDETPGMPEYISSIWGIPKRNQVYSAKPGTKEARLADLGVSASGFIPNFAPPTSAMRIPWFKKFGNASFDAIQPTLGISKASDTDTFRSSQFRSKAFDKAAIDGDPNLFAPLYEDFAFKAMQLISQSDIKDDLMRGYVLQPGTDQKQAALDAVYRKKGIGVEYKGYPKKNLTGTIGGELKRKYETLSKTNPEEAAKLQELIIAFNEVGHENQLPSDFGKNFSQLAGTSYSEMVKNSPDLVKGLSAETNMLLERYVKDPNFLRMNAAGGFIPNFANYNTDALERMTMEFAQKGKNGATLQDFTQFVIDLNNNKYGVGDSFHKDIIAKNFGEIVSDNDLVSPRYANTYLKGSYDKNSGKVIYYKSKIQELDPLFERKYSYIKTAVEDKLRKRFPKPVQRIQKPPSQRFRDQHLYPSEENHFNNGFIPNFNFIKGRNSFQKNWLIETAKKRNLNLNDPNTFTKLATEFAKTYPNDQGMFGLNKGFIPNFAYKQAVMGLEESMSGNKAIFDTKPFPHIRNSSQPTFSSAISDHGGLGNALSDSMRGQKAAGLMSRGLIPNFAPARGPRVGSLALESMDPSIIDSGSPVLPKNMRNDLIRSVNDLIKQYAAGTIDQNKLNDGVKALNSRYQLTQQSQQKLQAAVDKQTSGITTAANSTSKLAKSLSSASTAISLAGPMLAGFAEQALFGDRKRTDMSATERGVQSGLSTGLTAISTGAGIGAAFGPLGAGIGALIGVTVGLTSAFSATKLSAEELTQLNQEQTQKAQANISAASSYIEAQKSLTQMIASGASSSDIEIATKKLSNNFNEIKDVKLQEIFNATGGDVALMSKQLQDYTNQVTKESARQTGLYGNKLKPEERASALSLGLGKEGSQDFISKMRSGLQNMKSEREAVFKSMQTGFGRFDLLGFTKLDPTKSAEKLAKSVVPENEPDRESKIKALTQNILDKDFEKVLQFIEKNNITSDVNKTVQNFNQKATKSFNQIFLEMEQTIAKSAFDVALSFEKESGNRRVQSAILDFSMNFQDTLNSFISNNLPDFRKFDFTAATAGQKAQMLLQKAQQDYDKALADQANERSLFLTKSSETLTEKFKSSFLPSQASAQFFQNQVLPQIQAGTFSGNAKSLGTQFQTAAFDKANAAAKAVGITDLSGSNIEQKLKSINDIIQKLDKESKTSTPEYDKLLTARRSIIELEKQTALFVNENDEKKMQAALDTAARDRQTFEQKQDNAKKEAEINKQLTEANIQANEAYATKKAIVDKENFMRLENMKNVSAAINNNLEIFKATSNATINTLQGDLADPRLDYGLNAKEVTGRKIAIESQILKTQRAEEDAAINAEIQQRVLQMAAEQENTSALNELTKVIMDYMGNLLQQDLGGQEGVADIQNRINEMGPYAQKDVDLKYGPGSFAKFEAYKRTQQSKTSANVADKLNAAGFNATDSTTGKLLMTQEEQLKILTNMSEEYAKNGDVAAKGVVDRYKEEIINKKTSLRITRENIDEELRRKQILQEQSHILTERFKKGYSGMSAASDRMIEELVERTPDRFADGMTNALMEVAKGTKSIGDAFKDMAINFGQEIMQAVMRAAIGKMVGNTLTSLFGQEGGSVTSRKIGRQTGGLIYAQNGMYISGGRTGDKNPAMLEDGEYVLNREAVKAFGGPNALDTINYDMAPRFGKKMQSGGSFDLAPEMNYNKKGEYDYTGNLMSGSTNIGAINESDYTAYAFAESDYFKKMREKSIQDEQERVQKKFEKDQKNAQLISSIVGAVGSLALAGGMSLNAAQSAADATVKTAKDAGAISIKEGASQASKAAFETAKQSGGSALTNFIKSNPNDVLINGKTFSNFQQLNQIAKGLPSQQITGQFSKFGANSQLTTILNQQGFEAAKKTAGSGFFSNLFTTGVGVTGQNVRKGGRQTGGLIGFNSGGFVPYGSRLSDTIPALLTGGEYVMNNSAVKKYGLGTMSSMNAGAYQEGGSTATTSNNTNNNATNIAINIDKSGKSVYGADTSSYEKQDIVLTKQMARQINSIVLRSMSNEKRYGGELYKNSSRT